MTREVMRYKLNELRMMLNDREHTEEQGILVDIIKELDKAESDNKGEWIDNGNGSYTCSNCKTEWTTSQIEKMCFCPTCGADMRGKA